MVTVKQKNPVEYVEKKTFVEDPHSFRYYHFLPETFYFPELEPHWSEKIHIIYVVGGTKRYFIGENSYKVEAGDIIYIPPNVIHSAGKTGKKTDKDFEAEVFTFEPDLIIPKNENSFVLRIMQPVKDGTAPIPSLITQKDLCYNDVYRAVFKLKEIYLQRKPGYTLGVLQCLYEIYTYLFRRYGLNEAEKEQKDMDRKGNIMRAVKYIHENYAKDLAIEELASISTFSSPHFMSLFKQYMGTTCVSYINIYRLDKAAYKLINSEESIKDIALSCGYNNVSFFNRVFKKQFGETPREFRKRAFS